MKNNCRLKISRNYKDCSFFSRDTIIRSLNEPNVNKRENKVTFCSYSSRLCYLVQARKCMLHQRCIRCASKIPATPNVAFWLRFYFSTKFRMMHATVGEKMKDVIYACANCQGLLWHFFLALTLAAILSLAPAKARFTPRWLLVSL